MRSTYRLTLTILTVAWLNVNVLHWRLDINVPVVTCHASKQSSKMAMEGDYTPARLNALMYQRLVARNTYVITTMITMIN